jgi:hypothetical protein
MPSIGPQLPPELQKRKRSDNEDEEGNSSDSSSGPAPPSKPKEEMEQSPPSSKRTRVLGPAPPPAPLDERPTNGPEAYGKDGSSDEDDDYGPSLPSAEPASKSASVGPRPPPSAPVPAQRDEWMTLAPTSGDWSQRVDPTKLKSRKFNTGRGSKGPSQATGGDASWHETPEQKQARQKREVMGITDPPNPKTSRTESTTSARDEATAKRLKEFNVSPHLPPLSNSTPFFFLVTKNPSLTLSLGFSTWTIPLRKSHSHPRKAPR